MKKFLISLICVAAVVSLICGSAFSVSAETIKFDFKLTQPGWGTEEDGIIARFANSYPSYHTPYSEPGGHPNLNFENFVVGNTNRLAYVSARAVAEAPGQIHNPLFLLTHPLIYRIYKMFP